MLPTVRVAVAVVAAMIIVGGLVAIAGGETCPGCGPS